MMGHIGLFGIFVNWLPMLLLIGVWIFFMDRVRGRQDELKRAAEALERIATALEKRGNS